MEMPNYLDYDKMLSMGPWAQFQANEQLDLAKLFQAQKLQQEQATTEKLGLDNQYTSRTLEERVRKPGLENTGLEQDNRSKKYKADIEQATYPQAVQAKIAEYAKTKSDADLTLSENRIKLDLMSDDPVKRERATRAWELSQEIRKKKLEAQIALDKDKQSHDYRLKEIDRQVGGQIRVAEIGAESRRAAADLKKSVGAGKLNPMQAAVALLGAQRASGEISDEDYAAKLSELVNAELAARTAAASKGVTPQVDASGKVGITNAPPAPSVNLNKPKPVTDPTVKLPTGYTPERVMQEAQAAIKAGKNREAVLQRVRSMGLSTQGL